MQNENLKYNNLSQHKFSNYWAISTQQEIIKYAPKAEWLKKI